MTLGSYLIQGHFKSTFTLPLLTYFPLLEWKDSYVSHCGD